MTEAWRPFTDEEMRKIIEGERLAVNGEIFQTLTVEKFFVNVKWIFTD